MVWEAWRRFKSLYKYKSCRYTASHSFVLVPNGRPIIWRLRTQTSLPRIKKINFKPRDSYIIFHVSHICNPVSFLFVSNVDTVFLYISKSLQTTKPRMLGIHHAIEIDVCPQRGNSMRKFSMHPRVWCYLLSKTLCVTVARGERPQIPSLTSSWWIPTGSACRAPGSLLLPLPQQLPKWSEISRKILPWHWGHHLQR